MSLELLKCKTVLATVLVAVSTVGPASGAEYCDNAAISEKLHALEKSHPKLVRVRPLVKPDEGDPPLLVTLGKAKDLHRRPAILVVAGIEGNDFTGPAVALSWIESLLNQPEPLEETTIYVVPRLNTRAAARFFSGPKFETPLTTKPVDDDHDGRKDEDGPEDLNGDGLITMMRVGDAEGGYIMDPCDDRLMLEADHLEGEAGRWLVMSEGIDNDKDEQFNEDGPGGVNLNRNFPFDYDYFGVHSGIHQVSEPRTRALGRFVVKRSNIALVVTYGFADNVIETPAAAEPPGRRKPLTKIDSEDIGYFESLGELYRENLGLEKQIESEPAPPGTFSQWMYFHRGRMSLAVRPFSPKLAVEMFAVETDPNQSQVDEAERGKEARRQLEWFERHAPDAFVKWRAIEHPDFPGQKVEVGGYRPFAMTNPPENLLDEVVSKQVGFLNALTNKLGRIAVREIDVRHLGKSVFEIKIVVENNGFLPTMLSHGERSRQIDPTRLVVDLEDSAFISGSRRTFLPPIRGSSSSTEVRLVVRAGGRKHIDFEVVSQLAGIARGSIELKRDKQ